MENPYEFFMNLHKSNTLHPNKQDDDLYEFLPHRDHLNAKAMQEKLFKINMDWNESHPDELMVKERMRKVKFQSEHQLIILPDSDDDGEDAASNSSLDSIIITAQTEDDSNESDWYQYQWTIPVSVIQKSINEDLAKSSPEFRKIIPVELQELEANAPCDVKTENKAEIDAESREKENLVEIEEPTKQTNSDLKAVAPVEIKEIKNPEPSEAKRNMEKMTSMVASEIVRLVEQLRAPLELEERTEPVEVKSIPKPIEANKPIPKTKLTSNDYSISVIRAVFNMKSLGALRNLQNPEMLPLVRNQIRKRNLPLELLEEIFSENFIKLISNQDERNEEGKEAAEKIPSQESISSCQSADELQKVTDDNTSTSNDEEEKVEGEKEEDKAEEGRKATTDEKVSPIVQKVDEPQQKQIIKVPEVIPPSSSVQISKYSDLTKSESINLKVHVGRSVAGGARGVDSSLLNESEGNEKTTPKARPSSLYSKKGIKSTARPTSDRSSKTASSKREGPDNKAAAGRSFPLIDADWLQRKIRSEDVRRGPSPNSTGSFRNSLVGSARKSQSKSIIEKLTSQLEHERRSRKSSGTVTSSSIAGSPKLNSGQTRR